MMGFAPWPGWVCTGPPISPRAGRGVLVPVPVVCGSGQNRGRPAVGEASCTPIEYDIDVQPPHPAHTASPVTLLLYSTAKSPSSHGCIHITHKTWRFHGIQSACKQSCLCLVNCTPPGPWIPKISLASQGDAVLEGPPGLGRVVGCTTPLVCASLLPLPTKAPGLPRRWDSGRLILPHAVTACKRNNPLLHAHLQVFAHTTMTCDAVTRRICCGALQKPFAPLVCVHVQSLAS
ncbi:hypothetical protein COCVIDRAFT_17074 [Bipolaris victoriae FI3]|uniref:Uncharacterized protein n=1 Tax=Bipolaris victoriae (strain FI3) TaxID=930091 RepID=W7EN61_BIPV3|nr:hypothetical protein COCVIDRAFT_17074 [Bipolaris victoriae FI3]